MACRGREMAGWSAPTLCLTEIGRETLGGSLRICRRRQEVEMRKKRVVVLADWCDEVMDMY